MAAERVREWRRAVVVGCGFGALFVVVAVRAGQLTMIRGQRLAGLAHQQQHRTVELAPLRGPIVDRRGELLALTIDAKSLYAHPKVLRGDTEKIGPLAEALGLSEQDVQRKVAGTAPFVWLKRVAEPREVDAVVAVGARGVGALPARRRVYPRGKLAGHVLGFAGVDAQGLEGVERFYDRLIRPPSQVVEVSYDAWGRKMVTQDLGSAAAQGARVELTIDASLQAIVERELARGVTATHALAGTALVLDPRTGAVLAIANVPSFDPNDVGAAEPAARRNRAVTDMFEPGSTFKAILAAAALDFGVVTPDEPVFCEDGRYRVGRHVIRDHKPHEWLTFAEVVQYSSNIGTVKVAETLGAERFYSYVRAFGFGEKTGIDLPGEVAGQVRPIERWAPIHLATTSFGQGIAVTPVQLARAFAAIANGGHLVRPHIVRRIVAADGTALMESEPEMQRRVLRRDTATRVSMLLRRVVEERGGTGQRARLPGIAVAGKTGTAEKVDPSTGGYSPTARVASFAGFVPADAPRAVIVVLIDEPQTARYGGVVAAPVFREIAAAFLARFGIEHVRLRQVREVRGGRGESGVDDFLGPAPRAGLVRPGVRAS
jgi:cell division protein FtsI (penicillin-binding protein 3)